MYPPLLQETAKGWFHDGMMREHPPTALASPEVLLILPGLATNMRDSELVLRGQ